MTSGHDFYDEEAVFERYIKGRERQYTPNDTIEYPSLMAVIGDYQSLDILDLGCGDGRFGIELLNGGCSSYTGIEASSRMVELAKTALVDKGVVHHRTIEAWDYSVAHYDLVVSRLALHYVDNIETVFQTIYHALKPDGRFIFTVEHPVLTSHNESLEKLGGLRLNWIVDNYFVRGERNIRWMGSEVVKYHRTIEDYFSTLQSVGFKIEHLREPAPERSLIDDDALYERRKRIPLFLLLSARKT
ncbi:MAG: methyltransferase domain-containing protein [Chloroflexota bacterium]